VFAPSMARVDVVDGNVTVFPDTVTVPVESTGADENVCTPVNVWRASVRAIVAFVVGKVIVVLSVPANVIELDAVSVLPAAMFNVFVPLAVTVKPLYVSADAAPAPVTEKLVPRIALAPMLIAFVILAADTSIPVVTPSLTPEEVMRIPAASDDADVSALSMKIPASVTPVESAFVILRPRCVPEDEALVIVRVAESSDVVEEKAWLIAKSESLSRVRVTSFVDDGANVLFPVREKLVA
jgi:hypothetical protein